MTTPENPPHNPSNAQMSHPQPRPHPPTPGASPPAPGAAANEPLHQQRAAVAAQEAKNSKDENDKKDKKKKLRLAAPVAALVLIALCFGAGASGAFWATNRAENTTTGSLSSSVSTSTVTSSGQPPQNLAGVAAAVQPSVVSISISSGTAQGEGSGIVLREDGTILTNNHVIAAAATDAQTSPTPRNFDPNNPDNWFDGNTPIPGQPASIQVKFADGKTAQATIVGRDPSTDIAVIRAEDVSDARPAQLANSGTLNVGDTVLALGSPLGLDGSVSAGIVSALNRPVQLGSGPNPYGGQARQASAVTDAIQTDAAINPGNSGGALVDIQGRVVGVNTAIATMGSSGNIGLGFAIPIEQATSVADALLEGKKPTHSVLGVQTTDDPQGRGAVVAAVASNSPADKAGLRPGDIVTALGERSITDATGLAVAVRASAPGSTTELTYLRDDQSHTTQATLASTE